METQEQWANIRPSIKQVIMLKPIVQELTSSQNLLVHRKYHVLLQLMYQCIPLAATNSSGMLESSTIKIFLNSIQEEAGYAKAMAQLLVVDLPVHCAAYFVAV
jgi:hypothetical protein